LATGTRSPKPAGPSPSGSIWMPTVGVGLNWPCPYATTAAPPGRTATSGRRPSDAPGSVWRANAPICPRPVTGAASVRIPSPKLSKATQTEPNPALTDALVSRFGSSGNGNVANVAPPSVLRKRSSRGLPKPGSWMSARKQLPNASKATAGENPPKFPGRPRTVVQEAPPSRLSARSAPGLDSEPSSAARTSVSGFVGSAASATPNWLNGSAVTFTFGPTTPPLTAA
jgi:hypothetical protein